MAVLALFSHFYLREELRTVEWVGVSVPSDLRQLPPIPPLCRSLPRGMFAHRHPPPPNRSPSPSCQVLTAAAGAVGVGSIAAPAPQSAEEARLVPSLSAALALLSLLCALAGLEMLARAVQLRDKAPLCELSTRSRSLHELAAGIQGGLLFGLSAAASRATLLLSGQLGVPALIPLGACACTEALALRGSPRIPGLGPAAVRLRVCCAYRPCAHRTACLRVARHHRHLLLGAVHCRRLLPSGARAQGRPRRCRLHVRGHLDDCQRRAHRGRCAQRAPATDGSRARDVVGIARRHRDGSLSPRQAGSGGRCGRRPKAYPMMI